MGELNKISIMSNVTKDSCGENNPDIEYNLGIYRDFEHDLITSNNPLLRKSWETVIRCKFGNDCEILWKDDKGSQIGFGTDLTVKTNKGRRYSIELKTRHNGKLNDPKWIMEIVSHIYSKPEKPRTHIRKKEGWIYSSTAEYIFHGTLSKDKNDIEEAIFYSLTPFKLDKYKQEFEQYEVLWLPTKFPNGQFQLTLNKLIPKEVIKRDASEYWEYVK